MVWNWSINPIVGVIVQQNVLAMFCSCEGLHTIIAIYSVICHWPSVILKEKIFWTIYLMLTTWNHTNLINKPVSSKTLGNIQPADAGLSTHSETYSSGVQELKSALGMNFLFIGVSKVTLWKRARWQSEWVAAGRKKETTRRLHC